MLHGVDPTGSLIVTELGELRPALAEASELFAASTGSAPPGVAGLVTLGASEIRASRCSRCAAQPGRPRPEYLPHHVGLAARIALQAWDNDVDQTLVLDLFGNELRVEPGCSHRSS